MAEKLNKTWSKQDEKDLFRRKESEMTEMDDNISEYRNDSMVCEGSDANLGDVVPAPLVTFPHEEVLDEDKNAIENLHKGVMVLSPLKVAGKEVKVKTFLSGLEKYKQNTEYLSGNQSSITEPVYRAHTNDGKTLVLETRPSILMDEEKKVVFKMKRKMQFSETESEDESNTDIVKPCEMSTGAIPKSYPLKVSPRLKTEVNVSSDDLKSLQMSPEYDGSSETSQTYELPDDNSNRTVGPSPSKRRRETCRKTTIVRYSPQNESSSDTTYPSQKMTIVRCSPQNESSSDTTYPSQEMAIVRCSPQNESSSDTTYSSQEMAIVRCSPQTESSSDTSYPHKSLTPEREIIDYDDETEVTRASEAKISVDSSIASEAISPDIPKCDEREHLFPLELHKAEENLVGPGQEISSDNVPLIIQTKPSSVVQDMQLHESPLDLSLSGRYLKEQTCSEIIKQKDVDSSDTRLDFQNVLPSTSEDAHLLSNADNTTESIDNSCSQMETITTGIEQMTLEQNPSPNSMSISESSASEEEHASDAMKSEEFMHEI